MALVKGVAPRAVEVDTPVVVMFVELAIKLNLGKQSVHGVAEADAVGDPGSGKGWIRNGWLMAGDAEGESDMLDTTSSELERAGDMMIGGLVKVAFLLIVENGGTGRRILKKLLTGVVMGAEGSDLESVLRVTVSVLVSFVVEWTVVVVVASSEVETGSSGPWGVSLQDQYAVARASGILLTKEEQELAPEWELARCSEEPLWPS
jgi:hypothetical protein